MNEDFNLGVPVVASERARDYAAARSRAPFASVEDFVRRTNLDERALTSLASAGAFESLRLTRRSVP